MINPIFKKYKFLYDYFETYFKQGRRFPQSLVFEGLDILSQYFFAQELARILNCTKNAEPDCACTNCKWIKEGKHPSVIIVTPLDFKEDASKTVISVKQIEKITSIIKESSDYHRFFIFSNAKIVPLNEFQKEKIQKFNSAGFSIETENWYPLPLNQKVFQEESSNALLKSTEEAPDRVTFVFLCNTKEDVISTIVSRSVVFKMPLEHKKNHKDVSDFFIGYPNFSAKVALELSQNVLNMAQEVDIIEILDSMQEYLLECIKKNPNTQNFIMSDIKKIQNAKNRIQALVSPKNALEALFITLSSEGRNL